MSGFSITVHVKSENTAAVTSATVAVFEAHGFKLLGIESAAVVVDDEDKLPPGSDWYGVMLSGAAHNGWVSLTVDDWQDSGVLARGLSEELAAPVMEIWVADEIHWGYNYYERGHIVDRFADDPASVAENLQEIKLYKGNAEALSTILKTSPKEVTATLKTAREKSGEFVGAPIDALGTAIGLHFEHALMGYEDFFDEDPDDYSIDLLEWPQFRHLAFRHPKGLDRLSE